MPLAPERRPCGGCTCRGLGGEQRSGLTEQAFSGCCAAGASFSPQTEGALDPIDQTSLFGWSDSFSSRSVGPASSGSPLRTRLLGSCSSWWFFGANFFLLAGHSFLRMFILRCSIPICQVISPHRECLGWPVWSPCSRRRTWLHAGFLFPPQACSPAGRPFLKRQMMELFSCNFLITILQKSEPNAISNLQLTISCHALKWRQH